MLTAVLTVALSDETPISATSDRVVLQARLVAPDSPPFHLKAIVSEKDNPDFKGEIEIFWIAPDKWRRTIQSPEFSQTLVVNGDKVLEQDSDNYFPLALQTLATALVDPKPLLDALRPGDRLETQANGHWKAPVSCSNPNLMRQNPGMEMVCHEGLYRGMETVGTPGHRVYFVDYKGFKGRHVARLVITSSEMSVGLRSASHRAVRTQAS
jgi:hypothetical protein